MSKALDYTVSIQKLVEEWKEEDIEMMLRKADDVIEDPNSAKSDILFARFAILGALYVQARRIERGL